MRTQRIGTFASEFHITSVQTQVLKSWPPLIWLPPSLLALSQHTLKKKSKEGKEKGPCSFYSSELFTSKEEEEEETFSQNKLCVNHRQWIKCLPSFCLKGNKLQEAAKEVMAHVLFFTKRATVAHSVCTLTSEWILLLITVSAHKWCLSSIPALLSICIIALIAG